MKARLPLYAKILFWFFLNLTGVAAASWLLLALERRLHKRVPN